MNQSLPLYQHVDAVDDTVYLTSVSAYMNQSLPLYQNVDAVDDTV